MAKKQKRKIFHLAMLSAEFQNPKKYLDEDDEPVFLTFLNVTRYKGEKGPKYMIKTAFEKAGG